MPRPSQNRIVRDKAERSSVHFQKTKMCKFHLLGVCTRGSQCSWAHSPDEMKALPDFYRTKLCHTYLSKGMCRNAECRYAHGYHELRTTDGEVAHPIDQDSGSSQGTPTLQQAFPSMQWGSDVQFAFMQVIPFASAMGMADGGMCVQNSLNWEKGMDKERRGSKKAVCLSRQTTAGADEHLGGMVTSGTSEDGDLWANGSDQSSNPDERAGSLTDRSPSRASSFDDIIHAEDLMVRVSNTFLEFGSAPEINEIPASADFALGCGSRRRSRSMGARVGAVF